MFDQSLTIPGVELRSLNRDLRGTTMGGRMAAAAKAKQQRTGVATMCWSTFGQPPSLPLIITITRVGPRELDGDNLQGACKHVRDGIADWLGVNDRDKRIQWKYAQARCGAKEYGVTVRVEHWAQSFGELLACDKVYQDLSRKILKLSQERNKRECELAGQCGGAA